VTAFRMAAIGLVCSAGAFAHHSFSAEFDSNRVVHLKGTLRALDWSNPHTVIYLNVPTGEGRIEEWMVEAAAPGAMMRRGLRKEDFKVGAPIAIEGEQARDGSNRINGLSVTLEDGRTLSLRNTPAASLSRYNPLPAARISFNRVFL
jgi:hypothetical protein